MMSDFDLRGLVGPSVHVVVLFGEIYPQNA